MTKSSLSAYERGLHRIGTWFQSGRETFMNAKPDDLDGDGSLELLVTRTSTGS